MNKNLAIWQFIKERFDPITHSVMIVLFVGGHLAYLGLKQSAGTVLGTVLLTTLFFLKLRCYDEIKDYDTDLKINPHRPLPRGLVVHRDLYTMIITIIILEIILCTALAQKVLPFFFMVILYSLLMYKEFFIGKLIRPHLTTYAVSHTIVTLGLSLSLLGILAGDLSFKQTDILFAMSSWALFNLFEFGRKTYSSSEERSGVATYSNIWGRSGAVLLSFSQAVLSSLLLLLALSTQMPEYLPLFLWFLPILLLALGSFYLLKNSKQSAKLFRAMSSGYIILIYLALNSLFFFKS